MSIGVSERDAVNGTLYNTNLFFSPEGELITVHRKLKPTGAERVVWGDADKDYFPVAQTPWGVMGSLICWESYMPLARVALYQKGVSLYISPNYLSELFRRHTGQTLSDYLQRLRMEKAKRLLEEGELPAEEMPRISRMVEDICYYNAKRYFAF